MRACGSGALGVCRAHCGSAVIQACRGPIPQQGRQPEETCPGRRTSALPIRHAPSNPLAARRMDGTGTGFRCTPSLADCQIVFIR
ncbi:MAG: hypothetical protein J6S82_10130 [Bacteroidales bacterium]|nr:hypothetical protein [Bacteroidales bacterium]